MQKLQSTQPVKRNPGRYAVYAGDGVYVAAALIVNEADDAVQMVCFGTLDCAISLDRDEARRACYAARNSGVPSWVVRHPATALDSPVGDLA